MRDKYHELEMQKIIQIGLIALIKRYKDLKDTPLYNAYWKSLMELELTNGSMTLMERERLAFAVGYQLGGTKSFIEYSDEISQ